MADPIPFAIADTARLFRKLFNARSRSFNLTGQQWRVLVILSRNPGINQGAAAELLEVEPITLSRMIDRLTEAKLVERRGIAHDRRVWSLHLTQTAAPVIEGLRSSAATLIDQALAGFDGAERDQFSDYLDRMRANMVAAQENGDEWAA